MTELLTAAQMRGLEQAAISSGAVTGLELMERAGRGVVKAVFAEWPELASAPHRAVVLCGPGNNGGDGFVVARLLKEWGWEVEAFLYGDPERLPPDARTNHERWLRLGAVSPWTPQRIGSADADLYVDAVFGAGLTRAVSNDVLSPFAELHISGKSLGKLVCIDAPSGLCMDSGRAYASDFAAVFGALTVTFHRARVGHYLADGPDHCGKLVVHDIGLNGAAVDGQRLNLAQPDPSALRKHSGSNKFSHGHALVLSGGPGRGGAARLAARGALRMGAGLVTVGCPPAALQENAARLDAVMLRPVKGAAGLAEFLEDGRINALCLGPGLGLDEAAAALVKTALGARRATVVDADALTLLSRDPTPFMHLHETCVLTPHAGEFARLFPDLGERLRQVPSSFPPWSKVDAARQAAARAGCVVLFKGPDTVIAAPDGRLAINAAHYGRAAPWLATAGSGDVLAGFIAGLLARGVDPMQAAETAAWLHVECALRYGPGLIAEDLPEILPRVMQGLGI